jgi:hypothetical protein
MTPDQIIFAGVEISSGRKPVTFAGLDNELNVQILEKWDLPEALTCFRDYESIWLAINMPSIERDVDKDFRRKLIQVGFRSYSGRNDPKQFLVTNAQDCFRALIGQKALPRRTLEGRLQRSAVLYEQGLQITDPIEVFEEITRYRLVQGILPLQNIYSPKELDVLMAAYLTWMVVNRPGGVALKAEFALPTQEQSSLGDESPAGDQGE